MPRRLQPRRLPRPRRGFLPRTASLLAVLLLAGCASNPFESAATAAWRAPVELADTPFFPQEKYQCGPAALATVLVRSGVEVGPRELVPKVYLPAREGSLQPELLAASREYGRLPYVIAPDLPALLAEVAGGRPVLVLQNLGVKLIPAWHYAVVVGFSPATGDIVLRSGTDRRRVTDAGVFLKTWERSGHWGVVLLGPGELPAAPDPRLYLKAAAAAESAGRLPLATAAYRAAIERWPDSALAAFGLGNAVYAHGDLAEAERWYRRSLALDRRAPATLNNLAAVVAEQGRCAEGASLIERAATFASSGTPLAATIAQTKSEIAACTPAP